MQLQIRRSAVANKAPTAAQLVDGEIVLNTNAADPALFFKNSNGQVVRIGNASVGGAAPTSPMEGQVWIDNSGSKPVLKVYNANAWVEVGGSPAAGGGATQVPDASPTVKGIVELADLIEVITGRDNTRAVTPAGLKGGLLGGLLPSASASHKGIVELATAAETAALTDAARAVTPASLRGALSTSVKRVYKATKTFDTVVQAWGKHVLPFSLTFTPESSKSIFYVTCQTYAYWGPTDGEISGHGYAGTNTLQCWMDVALKAGNTLIAGGEDYGVFGFQLCGSATNTNRPLSDYIRDAGASNMASLSGLYASGNTNPVTVIIQVEHIPAPRNTWAAYLELGGNLPSEIVAFEMEV